MATKYLSYKLLIDPLTKGIRSEILKMINQGASVLDIGCGTGALAMELAGKGSRVVGIDLDESKIREANSRAKKLNLNNVQFDLVDAARMEDHFKESFDYAVLSLAIHQFPEPIRTEVLKNALRISENLILADYSVPVPKNLSGMVSQTIEKLAGKEHYMAYRSFVKGKGIPGLVDEHKLQIEESVRAGNGVFSINRVV